MRVSVCLGAILIPECLDFYSGYSTPRSRIAGIYSGIYSYSGISQTNAPLVNLRKTCRLVSLLFYIADVRVVDRLYDTQLEFVCWRTDV